MTDPTKCHLVDDKGAFSHKVIVGKPYELVVQARNQLGNWTLFELSFPFLLSLEKSQQWRGKASAGGGGRG